MLSAYRGDRLRHEIGLVFPDGAVRRVEFDFSVDPPRLAEAPVDRLASTQGYFQGVRCHHCGHENEPGAHFCASCGIPLSGYGEETLSLAGLGDLVEMLETDPDLAEALAELPDGQGMLLVRHGSNAGSRYWLEGDATALGRHPNSDVFLDDMTVSHHHAVIRRRAGGYEITDASSLNGTYLDHERVDTARLHHLAEIQIGKFVFVFALGGHA